MGAFLRYSGTVFHSLKSTRSAARVEAAQGSIEVALHEVLSKGGEGVGTGYAVAWVAEAGLARTEVRREPATETALPLQQRRGDDDMLPHCLGLGI